MFFSPLSPVLLHNLIVSDFSVKVGHLYHSNITFILIRWCFWSLALRAELSNFRGTGNVANNSMDYDPRGKAIIVI